VNSNSNPHQHVLRPFHNLSLDLQEVGSFKGLEAKVIIVKVPIIDDLRVQASRILKQKENVIDNPWLIKLGEASGSGYIYLYNK